MLLLSWLKVCTENDNTSVHLCLQVQDGSTCAAAHHHVRLWVCMQERFPHSRTRFMCVRACRTAARARQHVTMYTFGAPRVGNKAFSDSFNKLVPDRCVCACVRAHACVCVCV